MNAAVIHCDLNINYLLIKGEVHTGNIKIRPCRKDWMFKVNTVRFIINRGKVGVGGGGSNQTGN